MHPEVSDKLFGSETFTWVGAKNAFPGMLVDI